jgi:RecJ-like exonuclease
MKTCDKCHGTGFVVECVDDLCNGQDYCIHGDGNVVCPECRGDGEVPGDDDGPEATR